MPARALTRAPSRLLGLGVILAVILALGPAHAARAQGPAYSATPPSKGALASDGPADRYLLGGAWLYRDDLGNVGVSQGWWRNVAATDGWSPSGCRTPTTRS